jgi:ATP-dependent DNA helicase PIF1
MRSLSPEQQYAFNLYTKGENLFITGPGGTGKTELIKHLVNYAIATNNSYQVCALTGCASLLLNCNARTLHSWSGIKLAKGLKNTIIHNVLKNKMVVNSWKKIKILIVDEVSMLSLKIFEIIEEIACNIRRNAKPFGGIQVIFTGDFFQLPPVGNNEDPDTEKFCFQSSKWFYIFPIQNHIQLTTMFRQKDPLYANILLEIRTGSISEENKQILQKYVKRDLPEEYTPTKLFAIRSKTDFVNNEMFSKLKEDLYEFHSDIKTNCKMYLDNTAKPFTMEVLNKCQKLSAKDIEKEVEFLTNNIPCSKIVSLKKGAIVMCLINYDIDKGICNGSQGIIVDFIENEDNTIPIVKFTNGVTIPVDYHYWQSEEFPTIAVGQIPLCLAWAITIHKIQGSTMAMAEIDIGYSVFEYGQVYVALSRIQSLDGLYLISFQPHKIKANPIVNEFYNSIPSNIPIEIINQNNEISKTPPFSANTTTKSINVNFEQFNYINPNPIPNCNHNTNYIINKLNDVSTTRVISLP